MLRPGGSREETVSPEHDDEIETAAGPLSDLSRLSGWVAHEINNPLGGIQNAFALIRDAIPATHQHFRYVAAIEREIARVAAVTQRLQQTYGYDSDRAVTVPLTRYVQDAMRALEPLRLARRVDVRVDIAASAASEPASGELLRGTVRHLMQHGIETALPDGTIRIAAWREARVLWLSVPSRAPQDGEGRGAMAGPPGLALQLVRRLVQSLHGEVVLASSENGSSEVRVGVPVRSAAPEGE